MTRIPGFTSEASLAKPASQWINFPGSLSDASARIEPQQGRGDEECWERTPCRNGKQTICCKISHCYLQWAGGEVCSWGKPFCFQEAC